MLMRTLAVGAVSLALALAACGDGESDSGADGAAAQDGGADVREQFVDAVATAEAGQDTPLAGDDVRCYAEAVVDAIGVDESARIKPKVLSSQIIRRIDDHHAQLVNRTRHGQMIIPGQTLYVLECEPAAYAALAANEAEKAANINVLEVRAFGSVGRVYLGGEERDIDVGWQAAVAALEGLSGRES